MLYLDALQVKVKDQGAIRNKAIYLALGVGLSGEKELLGLWVSQTEGAKFWLQVLTELRNRGVSDLIIACVGRADRLPRGDRDGVSQHPGAIVYRASVCATLKKRTSLEAVLSETPSVAEPKSTLREDSPNNTATTSGRRPDLETCPRRWALSSCPHIRTYGKVAATLVHHHNRLHLKEQSSKSVRRSCWEPRILKLN